MPRKPRAEVADGVYHVYARGNRRRRIYLDDADMRRYLRMLGEVVGRFRWRCLAYCLMPNHVHLLLETPEPNLGRGMQVLHGRYAHSFNKRHGESGHVFQGRYGATHVTTEEQLWLLFRYLAHNPVEAGLSATPADWRWSSHRATLGAPPPAWLDVTKALGYLEPAGGDPRDRYRELLGYGYGTPNNAAVGPTV